MTAEHTAEKDARSTHNVYRITGDLRYEETPCFCPANRTHSILDTCPIPPATPDHERGSARAERMGP